MACSISFDLYQSNISSASHKAEITFHIFYRIFVLQIVKPESEIYVILVSAKVLKIARKISVNLRAPLEYTLL